MFKRTSIAASKNENRSWLKKNKTLQVARTNDHQEREAHAIADSVLGRSRLAIGKPSFSTPSADWFASKARKNDQGETNAKNSVSNVVNKPGQTLTPEDKSYMEARFGLDFSQVRIHTGSQAAESARTLQARAYTTGNNIVFGAGQYRPNSRSARYILAHELAHVAQQSPLQSGNDRYIQRIGIFESIARFFGSGTFSESELLSYIDFLKTKKTIEDAYDSDNKARDVVVRWKKGDSAFTILTVPIRILLINEMASGYLSSDDQSGILSLLEDSITSELTAILAGISIASLKGRFDGKYAKRLKTLLSDQEEEDLLAALGENWNVIGVMEILHRHGDEHIIKTILDTGYKIIRFDSAFDKWRYADGSIKENELTGLQGNTLRSPLEIRIRNDMSDERAAATLYHEVSHVQSVEPDYLKQEIDVRVETEEFKIRHGLPPTRPGYRNPDGTVNREFIKKEIESSSHYNPVGRTRIGRRYVNEREVTGWKMP